MASMIAGKDSVISTSRMTAASGGRPGPADARASRRADGGEDDRERDRKRVLSAVQRARLHIRRGRRVCPEPVHHARGPIAYPRNATGIVDCHHLTVNADGDPKRTRSVPAATARSASAAGRRGTKGRAFGHGSATYLNLMRGSTKRVGDVGHQVRQQEGRPAGRWSPHDGRGNRDAGGSTDRSPCRGHLKMASDRPRP